MASTQVFLKSEIVTYVKLQTSDKTLLKEQNCKLTSYQSMFFFVITLPNVEPINGIKVNPIAGTQSDIFTSKTLSNIALNVAFDNSFLISAV